MFAKMNDRWKMYQVSSYFSIETILVWMSEYLTDASISVTSLSTRTENISYVRFFTFKTRLSKFFLFYFFCKMLSHSTFI